MGEIPLSVAFMAFAVNIAVMIWTAARAQAKSEAAMRELLATERETRANQFYEAREFARSQAAIAVKKADEASAKITEVEMQLLKSFQDYPTKSDIRDMFSEKFEPVAARLDTVYDELMRRGVQTTALRKPGDKP